jgi:hypothetical protein
LGIGVRQIIMLERQETLPMRRRRLLLVVGAVVLLGVAGFVLLVWLTKPTPGVTWDNFRRLREGMSPKDVEALLGEPYDVEDYRTYTNRYWRGEEVVKISLEFTEDGLKFGVAGHGLGPVEGLHTDESLLDRIRRWLHL